MFPFLKDDVAIIFLYLLMVGIVYGRTVGTMNSDRDVINAMAHAMSTLGLYIALVFLRPSSSSFSAGPISAQSRPSRVPASCRVSA